MLDFATNMLPKADCHVHANGMATDQDVLRLAYKYGVDLSRPPHERSYLQHIRSDGSRDWANGHHAVSHEAYDETVSLIRAPEDLTEIVKSALLRQNAENCIYTRILSAGLNNCRSNHDVIPVFEKNMLALVAAINGVRDETGIEAFISVSAKRHLVDAPAKAHRLLDACEAFQRKYPDESCLITGFDMAGNEEKANCAEFHSVYERATLSRQKGGLGLRGSCHAGEVLSAEDIWAALRLPGIEQISHALSAIDDPDLIQELKTRGVLVDQLLICNGMLQSQRFAAPDSHPARHYFNEGLCLALGSDDPGIQNSNIGHEYERAQRLYGFTPAELLTFTANAIRHGFMPTVIKEKLLQKVADFASDHFIALRPGLFEGQGITYHCPFLEAVRT